MIGNVADDPLSSLMGLSSAKRVLAFYISVMASDTWHMYCIHNKKKDATTATTAGDNHNHNKYDNQNNDDKLKHMIRLPAAAAGTMAQQKHAIWCSAAMQSMQSSSTCQHSHNCAVLACIQA